MKQNKYPHQELTEQIIGTAITVHKALGPGLLETIYEKALAIELKYAGLIPECQVPVPIMYRGHDLGIGYRIDIVVNNLVCLEIKAIERVLPVHQAQLLRYLYATELQVGLLLNFNSKKLVDGLTRKILQYPSAPQRLCGDSS